MDWKEPDFQQPLTAARGMHLWAVRSSAENARYQSDAEIQRGLNIKDDDARHDHAIAQGGLRRILAAYTGENPRTIALRRATHGKPYIEGGPEFNLSHTRNQVFVIVSRHEVGLDVEAVDRRVRAQELAAKFFHPTEQALLRDNSEEKNMAMFLRLWVCKESMVKLSGDGIYHGLRDARVLVGDDGFSRGEYRGRPVWLTELKPAPGLLGAVSSWQNDQVNSFFRL